MNVPEENDEERQALHAAIEEGLQEADAGDSRYLALIGA